MADIKGLLAKGWWKCYCNTLHHPKSEMCRVCSSRRLDAESVKPAPAKKKGRLTKTEQAYMMHLLLSAPNGADIRSHAIAINLLNGHRYNPDFVVQLPSGVIECHEVKGAYRLGSLQRSRLAFDQARVEWPCFEWVWATKDGDGWLQERLKGGCP